MSGRHLQRRAILLNQKQGVELKKIEVMVPMINIFKGTFISLQKCIKRWLNVKKIKKVLKLTEVTHPKKYTVLTG